MGKLPWFQFYPNDWRGDGNLSRCSKAAKGVWIDMLCLMFNCEERGVLASNGKPWSDQEIAEAVGGDTSAAIACIAELLAKGVASRNAQGAIFNRRMVADEHRRKVNTLNGQRGGNPSLSNSVNRLPNRGANRPPNRPANPPFNAQKSEVRSQNLPSSSRAGGFSPTVESEPVTDFHIASLTAVEAVFGDLTATDRRRLAEWTIAVEASPSVRIESEGKDVPATEIASEGIREAIAAGADDSVGGFIGFVNKCIGRSRRKGVRPGTSVPLKPTAATAPIASQREDFDGCLPGETTLQALVRKGKL